MTAKTFGMLVMAGVVFTAVAYAQTDNNTPPNAVDDRSFVDRPAAEQTPADISGGYVFDQSSLPLDTQAAIPMAPRVNKGTEIQPVDRAAVR